MRVGSFMIAPYQFKRLYEIERLIQKFRSVSILEYGVGISSSIFIKLAGNNFFFQTTDEMKEWMEKLCDRFPLLKSSSSINS